MSWMLLALTILTPQRVAAIDAYRSEAAEIYACDFGPEHDLDFDRWPDDWTRRSGRGFPRYLNVEIKEDRPPGEPFLHMELDGGAAVVYSPPIDVSLLYSYVAETRIATEGLKYHEAFFTVSFLDQARQPLEVYTSAPVRGSSPWRVVRIGPLGPSHPDVRYAIISLHLEPTQQGADLFGSASFNNVWLGQLPRMTLRTDSPHNVFLPSEAIQVSCEVSGVAWSSARLDVELFDAFGQPVAPPQSLALQPDDGAAAARGRQAEEQQLRGVARWQLPLEQPGFYRLRVSMRGRSETVLERTTSIVRLPGDGQPAAGRFGWSLPTADPPLDLATLAELFGRVAVSWVKLPVWYSDHDQERADELSWFAERLGTQHIELVGVLDQPPSDVRERFDQRDQELPVALIFMEPALWKPLVDPVMTRLSLRVHWWQLGSDADLSYVNFPLAKEKIHEVREHLTRFGQAVNLGIPWSWLHQAPSSRSASPWDYLCFTTSPTLTAEELGSYLDAHADTGPRWALLEPLPRSEYTLPTRARDLVERMLAASVHGAQAVFVPDPFDDERGLMNDDGTPGELLLPWRTTSLMLSGAEYLGSIQMLHGSQNHVFVRNGQAIMVIWNDVPVTESLYLGEEAAQVDLWGNATPLPLVEESDGLARHQLEVERVPTFVTGVHPAIARWRMTFAFQNERLSSIFGRAQEMGFSFENHFEQGVDGRVTFHAPSEWEIDPRVLQFRLAAGQRQVEQPKVLLQANAASGPQLIRIDFDVTAERSYRFSVYRTVDVGLGDVLVELTTRLDPLDRLVVEQTLVNQSGQPVSFNCLIFAPARRTERIRVLDAPPGRTVNVLVLDQGSELVGKPLWLRAEEIGGQRILNSHLIIQP